ncbi:UNVERIFIED_CONTAM: hypothetical protein GTU68_052146 [Idotea baltica]|nr:hypothetical protein [Idotea baltica]
MSLGQQRGLDLGWSKFGLDVADGIQGVKQSFKNNVPCTLEIGFGMGASLLEMAQNTPNHNFIGVEVHKPGVGGLLNSLLTNEIQNVRIYRQDAIEVLQKCIQDASLDRVLLLFPDPWHKARHNKRRIVRSSFAQLVSKKLKIGGVLHMATDWEPYAEHMLSVMNDASGYVNLAKDGRCVPRPIERPKTKFECRGERLGHGVWDLKFQRIF